MKTEIIVIADESGSMAPLANDANGSFANFVNEQRDVPGEARLTLTKFSSDPHPPNPSYQAVDIRAACPLDLAPSGMTALFDAIGHTIAVQGKRIEMEKWADLVVVVILTDGEENSSKEYTLEMVKKLTQEKEAAGWKFIYLMSNQDAFAQAQKMGSSGAFSMSHAASAAGTQDSYSYASAQTRNFRDPGNQDK